MTNDKAKTHTPNQPNIANKRIANQQWNVICQYMNKRQDKTKKEKPRDTQTEIAR